jgi:hypothetical protein
MNRTTRPIAFPAQNIAIGRRLFFFFNDYLGMNCTEFGRRLEIENTRIANYITGRSPVSTDIFHRMYVKFLLSPKWLATGEGSMEDRHQVLGEEAWAKANLAGRFSDAWRKVFEPLYTAQEMDVRGKVTSARETLAGFLSQFERGMIEPEAIVTVADAAVRFWTAHPKAKGRIPRGEDHPFRTSSVTLEN